MPDCIFCKIVEGKIPVKKLAETDRALAFPDIDPQAPEHFLVIPKQHLVAMTEVTDWSLVGHLHEVAVGVARERMPNGFRTLINTGPDGVQTVFHVHLHCLGGRPMRWPPG
ncbi:MAG: histidine triad nucleotide-binding protein [Deltaproteobacteria bacterium]|nr:MAG: histidine triad nucleotide-binding protein [Deltaproteobacteria bacterium]TMB31094.1 MAG: histidine triad nucleotide-binding protein [Deltaproteobacteria bacterium]TMB37871.1 MAG: histidine triad nucleotide-binding protein [Deltaproteobacteria bacterium]